jgi:hypothetical protein
VLDAIFAIRGAYSYAPRMQVRVPADETAGRDRPEVHAGDRFESAAMTCDVNPNSSRSDQAGEQLGPGREESFLDT